jgi:uncharacterized cupin superfamily protein
MDAKKIIITRQANITARYETHAEYEYYKHTVLPKDGNQCTVTIMEIPPGKAAFPYHYHVGITEVFYIISGEGRLETPEGEKKIIAGDIIVFPCGEEGCHKIWNSSDTETLRYLDYGTTTMSDVIFYPQSDKIGMILNGTPHSFFKEADKVDYYNGEE